MIKGKKVVLRPLNKQDFPVLHKWLNDSEVMQYWYGRDKPQTREWVEKHYMPAIEGKVDYRYWIIEAGGKPIGYM